jgi:hypothetical protein
LFDIRFNAIVAASLDVECNVFARLSSDCKKVASWYKTSTFLIIGVSLHDMQYQNKMHIFLEQ